MKTRRNLLLAALGGTTLVIGTFSLDASASTCAYTYGINCYGETPWSGAPKSIGSQMDTYVSYNSHAVDTAQNGHINETLWQTTNNGSGNAIEVGWIQGWNYRNDLIWYWADDRPGSHFIEHAVAPNYPGGTHTLDIVQDPRPNTWQIWIDGTVYGYSTNSPWYGYAQAAGVESTDTGSHIDATNAYNLWWKDPSSTWHSGWSSGLLTKGPCYASWVSVGSNLYNGCN